MADIEERAAAPNQRQDRTKIKIKSSWTATFTYKWSNFKPEFLGKSEEDAEAHLLHSNDWMNAHHINDDVKVQRFCLTLLGEARLWFHSLEPLDDTT